MMFLALLLLLWTQVVCATHGDPMALSITPAVIFASRLDTFCQIELLTIPITPTLQRCYTQAIERNSQISPQEADNIGNCVLFTDGLSPFLHAVFDKFGDRFFATFVSLTTLSPAIAMAWSIDDLDKRLFLVRKVDCARTAPTRYVILLQYEKGFVHAEAMATPLREETNLSLFRLFCQDCGEVYQQVKFTREHELTRTDV